jgi:hypothetical protein
MGNRDGLKSVVLCWFCVLATGGIVRGAAPGVGLRFSVSEPGVSDRSEIVKVSLPVPRGALGAKQGADLIEGEGGKKREAEMTVLTRHPDGSVRRLVLRFPIVLKKGERKSYVIRASDDGPAVGTAPEGERSRKLGRNHFELSTHPTPIRNDRELHITPIAPMDLFAEPDSVGGYDRYHGVRRYQYKNEHYRLDQIEHVTVDDMMKVVLRLLRLDAGDTFCREFGFEIESRRPTAIRVVTGELDAAEWVEVGDAAFGLKVRQLAESPRAGVELKFEDGATTSLLFSDVGEHQRGSLRIEEMDGGKLRIRFLRSDLRANELVPMQEGSWRTTHLHIHRGPMEALITRVESPLRVEVDPGLYGAVYGSGVAGESDREELRRLNELHVQWLMHCQLKGDDFGNLTGWWPGSATASEFGMNRLNHAEYLFHHAFRTGDGRTRRLAIDWALNFVDLSIYWGNQEKHYGGTRYNNVRAMGGKAEPPESDRQYMWRSNTSVSFCTKGYSALYLAYEETGIPHLQEAALAQAAWCKANLHVDQGETRNVGGVADFVRMYEYTGDASYLDHAKRLFDELATTLTPELLFTQSGKAPTGDDLFIPDDQSGYRTPFIKPYITQYATNGLPLLWKHVPGHPKLKATILANSDFMLKSQDLSGGWAYPHPASQGIMLGQAMEFAHGFVDAHRISGEAKYLDGLERTLRARVQLFAQRGEIAAGVTAFEFVQGLAKGPAELVGMYEKATDRPRERDWAEGRLTFGANPDSLAYWFDCLGYYLKHRSADGLFARDAVLDQLKALPPRAESEGASK